MEIANLIVMKSDLDTLEKMLLEQMAGILPTDPDFTAKVRVVTTLMAQVAINRAMAKPAAVAR